MNIFQKYLLVFGLAYCFVLGLKAQSVMESEPVGSQVKFDLLGLYYPVAWYYGANGARVSVEFEKGFREFKNFSWVIDAAYSSYYYNFQAYHFVWPPHTSRLAEAIIDGWTTQSDFSASFGTRLFGRFRKDNVHFRWFVEPRLSLVFRRANLGPNSISLPFLLVRELGLTPRLRQGIALNYGAHWGCDLSVDVFRYQFIAKMYSVWRFEPELNLTYRF